MKFEALFLFLLGVSSLCLIALTATFLIIAKDLRRLLKHLEASLPAYRQTIQEIHRTVGVARQLLVRTDEATQQIVEPFVLFSEKARKFFAHYFGNGERVRSHPRRVAYRKG